VLIDGTCFQDMAGNAFSGIADPATWRFIARPWVVAFGAGAHGVLLGPSVQTVNDSAAAVAPGVQAAAGWAFTGWDTDIAHVRADLTVTAQYGRQTYAVSFLAGAGGSISGRAAQTVGHDGSTEPVTAEPDFGHVFVQWDDDSTANPRTLHHVTTATTRVASFRQAGAVPPRGTFLAQVDAAGVAAGHGLWDLTGPYAASVAGNLLTLNLLHDANGKLSGTASLQVNTGKAQVPVAMSIRGSTKGSGGALLVSLALQGANVAGAVSVSLALELTLNTAANQLSGPVAGSLTRGGVTTPVSQPQPIVLDIPAPMDGTWTLSLDLAQAPRTLSGTARLTLRNGVAHLYTLRGRPSGAAVLVALSADPSDPAARGTDVRATLETLEGGWARLQGLSGKAYGQTLIW
jgi:hypothetical protein